MKLHRSSILQIQRQAPVDDALTAGPRSRPVFLAARLIVAVSLVICGCGTAPQADYSTVELLDVSGVVTLEGEPLKNAVITFESVDTGS